MNAMPIPGDACRPAVGGGKITRDMGVFNLNRVLSLRVGA